MDFKKEFKDDENQIFINRLLEDFNLEQSLLSINKISQQKEIINIVSDDANKTSDDKEIKKRLTQDILYRQEKTRKAYESIDVVDSKIVKLTNILSGQLKDFDKLVYIGNDPILVKAVKKIFKKNIKYINKAMYLEACEKMQNLLENTIEIK